jgi:DNA-directed RNA polymerase specialized sigma24 family protein
MHKRHSPSDQLHQRLVKLGLDDRRYPFRAETEADRPLVRLACDQALHCVNDMIYKQVRDRHSSGLDDDTVNEIVQACRIWLWEKSLPRFDSERGVKLTTFLYRCISNFINQELRKMARHSRGCISVDSIDMALMAPDPSTLTTANIDILEGRAALRAADDILEHPDHYMTAAQAEVFRFMQANPHMSMKDMARALGYRRPSSLSMMVKRIRERITSVDINVY